MSQDDMSEDDMSQDDNRPLPPTIDLDEDNLQLILPIKTLSSTRGVWTSRMQALLDKKESALKTLNQETKQGLKFGKKPWTMEDIHFPDTYARYELQKCKLCPDGTLQKVGTASFPSDFAKEDVYTQIPHHLLKIFKYTYFVPYWITRVTADFAIHVYLFEGHVHRVVPFPKAEIKSVRSHWEEVDPSALENLIEDPMQAWDVDVEDSAGYGKGYNIVQECELRGHEIIGTEKFCAGKSGLKSLLRIYGYSLAISNDLDDINQYIVPAHITTISKENIDRMYFVGKNLLWREFQPQDPYNERYIPLEFHDKEGKRPKVTKFLNIVNKCMSRWFEENGFKDTTFETPVKLVFEKEGEGTKDNPIKVHTWTREVVTQWLRHGTTKDPKSPKWTRQRRVEFGKAPLWMLCVWNTHTDEYFEIGLDRIRYVDQMDWDTDLGKWLYDEYDPGRMQASHMQYLVPDVNPDNKGFENGMANNGRISSVGPEERSSHSIFGAKSPDYRVGSFYLPHAIPFYHWGEVAEVEAKLRDKGIHWKFEQVKCKHYYRDVEEGQGPNGRHGPILRHSIGFFEKDDNGELLRHKWLQPDERSMWKEILDEAYEPEPETEEESEEEGSSAANFVKKAWDKEQELLNTRYNSQVEKHWDWKHNRPWFPFEEEEESEEEESEEEEDDEEEDDMMATEE